MTRLITRGRFTQGFAKGLLAAPEDREPVVRKLIEAAGGKLISFYFTTGETDFLLISEADETEAIIAALLATAATLLRASSGPLDRPPRRFSLDLGRQSGGPFSVTLADAISRQDGETAERALTRASCRVPRPHEFERFG